MNASAPSSTEVTHLYRAGEVILAPKGGGAFQTIGRICKTPAGFWAKKVEGDIQTDSKGGFATLDEALAWIRGDEEAMVPTPQRLLDLATQGKEIFSSQGVYYTSPRGWLRDAEQALDTAQGKVVWLETGGGQSREQWRSRRRVIEDVQYSLGQAAQYILNSLAPKGLSQKAASPEMIQWAASVVSQVIHHPLGVESTADLQDLVGMPY